MVTIDEIRVRLDAYARSQGVLPQDGFCVVHEGDALIEGIEQHISEAFNFCGDCAASAAGSVDAPYHSVDLLQGEDTCCHCEGCGALLDYRLNLIGVESELDNFTDWTISGPISGETAFHIARVVEAARDDNLPDACMIGAIAISTFTATDHTAELERLKADRDRILHGAASFAKDARHFAERLRRHAATNYARSGNTDEQWASALDLAMLIQGVIGRPLPDEDEVSPLQREAIR